MTLQPSTTRRASDPIALGDRAVEDLRFIRRTMEHGTAFTAVPGWGAVAMGLTALVAAWVAARQPTANRWVAVWLVDAVLAIGIGALAIGRKARGVGLPVFSGVGRKFVLSFLPATVAGVVLTLALWGRDSLALLPGVWMLLYGASVVSAGTYSVNVVPLTGACFMLLGAVALMSPPGFEDVWMAAGFGGLHVLFGTIVARRYGG